MQCVTSVDVHWLAEFGNKFFSIRQQNLGPVDAAQTSGGLTPAPRAVSTKAVQKSLVSAAEEELRKEMKADKERQEKEEMEEEERRRRREERTGGKIAGVTTGVRALREMMTPRAQGRDGGATPRRTPRRVGL